VARVVPELIRTGRYAPPTLGLAFDARINAAITDRACRAPWCSRWERGSPGRPRGRGAGRDPARRRLRPGHVVVAVDGEPVASLDDLLALLDGRAAGDRVAVTFDLGGRQETVEMALEAG
jgi:S1-C subfamily serine protease